MKSQLDHLLKSEKKLLFIGIGNALMSDDAAGIYICGKIRKRKNIRTLIVESSIEKFVGKINSLEHDILILVDCTDFGKSPGHWEMVDVSKIADATVNTHTISLKRISEFFPKKSYLLGIQPQNTKFGEKLSQSVINTADEIVDLIDNS